MVSSKERDAGVIWILGRPASGKTTLAKQLLFLLGEKGSRGALVDSDGVRSSLTPDPSYGAPEREFVYRAMAYVARRLSTEGIIAVVSATAHDEDIRREVERICPGVFWVLASCSLETCEARDPKGLYRFARRNPASTLPGIGVPFRPPEKPGFVVSTESPVPDESLENLLEAFQRHRKKRGSDHSHQV